MEYGEVIPGRIDTSGGSSVTITCGSIRSVEWFSTDLQDKDKVVVGNELIISNTRKDHSGPYICRGYKGANKMFHRRSLLVVDGVLDIRSSSRIIRWYTENY